MFESFAPLRATRAAIFAAMCVALGAVGHSYMSGTDIPFYGLLGAFAVTLGLAWLAAGRRRGPVGIAVAVLAVQGVLHLVFSGSQATKTATGSAAMQQHHHMPAAGAGLSAAEAPGVADMADMAGMAGHGGAGMIAAHVLAGLLCAAWLARGEAAVFRLARVLGAAALHAARPLARALDLVRARVAAAPAPPASGARHPRRRARRLRGAVHAHAVVRRGPPRNGSAHRFTAPGRPARA
ncbi:hypothetical protein [Streptomyces virginiae]|uniref:hypothetical protein n=1 Tax=Streptomyces virginiae TaxID=1961 RepID=UPI002DB9156B|nr:hypothetical protein [Streptomyces sp. CMAA1738]MEC4574771.1 hypothetical protein [Streptomyces sp. CMAA1738]